MTDEDVEVIKGKLNTDGNMKVIHDYIMAYADRVLSMSDLEYKLESNRLLAVSQAAGERITSCAYAYRMTGDSKYLERAEKDMQTVCAFPDWHTAHWLDTGEMCFAVGLGYDWLYNELSSETKKAAETAIRDLAFKSALSLDISNPNGFYSMAGNWNQVCNGGLVVAALAIYESDEEDARAIIDKAVTTNRTAMEGIYGSDGNYPEGYGYWGYGTDYECLMLSAMESCLGSDFGLSNNEGFSKTGEYIMFMEGTTDRCFNYSDCASTLVPFPALWYLADRFDAPSLLFNELRKLGNGLYSSYSSKKYYILSVVHGSRFDLGTIEPPQKHVYEGDGINPVCLVRTDWTFSDTDKFLGIKGGQANYSHAQMDLGSFVYDAYGLRVSADLGLQSYGTLENLNMSGYSGGFGDYMSQNSFRWACFRYNNYNHSTLTINNALHKFNAKAPITNLINTPTSKGGVVDLSDALSAECASATRTVTIDNDRDLIVKDVIKALNDKAAEVRWTMVTMCPPEIESGRIVLQGKNRDLYLTVTSAKGAAIRLTSWGKPPAGFSSTACGETAPCVRW